MKKILLQTSSAIFKDSNARFAGYNMFTYIHDIGFHGFPSFLSCLGRDIYVHIYIFVNINNLSKKCKPIATYYIWS